MRYKIYFCIFMFLSINIFPQSDNIKKDGSTPQQKILRSYLNAGIGRTQHYLNLGAGLFFSLGENILLGPRANANFEVNVFQTPAENSFDLDLEVRYVPFLSDHFLISVGGGLGFFTATKRGELIRTNAFISPEYEKVHTSSVAALFEIEGGLLLTKNFGINITGYSLFANKEILFRFQIGFFLCKILD